MNRILALLKGTPEWLRFSGTLLVCLMLGVADCLTGDLSLMMFYLFPMAFASWFVGKRAGWLTSLICSLELVIINLFVDWRAGDLLTARSWNVLVEACFLLLVGYLLSKVRTEMELTRQKSRDLEAANVELEAFNFTVAHDLRTPLSVVLGYCEAVRELYGDRLDEQGRRYLQESCDGTLRMHRLINALLNFSRISYVEPRREPVDLTELADEVAQGLRISEPGRSVRFRIAEGISALTDANLARVVLENLLGNAWKYTARREEAVIEFGAMMQNGEQVYFVRDNGIGFDQQSADKLFLPFQRLSGGREARGFGIGLATVERIVRRQGGRIWAEGEPGKGAGFYFTSDDAQKSLAGEADREKRGLRADVGNPRYGSRTLRAFLHQSEAASSGLLP